MPVVDEKLIKRLEQLTPAKRRLLRRRFSFASGRPGAPAESRIPKIPREGKSFAPSFAQERLWVLSQLIPAPEVYNISAAFEVFGDLDLPRLEAALQALAGRHESLRTSFTETDGDLRQVIHPAIKVLVEREEAPSRPEMHAQWMIDLASRLARIPFDLRQLPLLRVTAARLAADHHVLVIVMHHIISDAWSASLMVRELAERYSQATAAPNPEDRIDYADYALWQRLQFSEGADRSGIEYWKAKLKGCPETLELPCDKPRPAKMTYWGKQIKVEANGDFKRDMMLLAQEAECSPGTLMLSIVQGFLARYTGQMDFTIGIPVANRQHLQTRDILGFFVNTLVLRQAVSLATPFREHLDSTKSAFLEAQEHQDVPFEKVVEELRPARSLANTPLFEVLFNYLEDAALQLELPGMRVREIDFDPGITRVSLSVDVRNRADGLSFAFQYSDDLFEHETIQDMAENFLFFAQEIFREPGKPLSGYRMIAPSQYTNIVSASSGIARGAR